jgi:hypothetical protein
MVIGRAHRYLFIEVPGTGSSAIAAELVQNYGGERVLYKHATYGEFLRTPEGRSERYFVFAGVRHPLDLALSSFFKMKTNHRGRYTCSRRRYTPSVTAKHIELFEYAQNEGDFLGWFKKSRPSIYNNFYLLLHQQFDYIIRYEELQAGFSEVLRRIGVPAVRPLPVVYRTRDKSTDFWQFYPEDIRARTMRAHWPFMRRWGYAFPPEWGAPRLDPLAEIKFVTTQFAGTMASRLFGIGPSSPIKWAVELRDVARQWWA